MFQLTWEEVEGLMHQTPSTVDQAASRPQNAILKRGRNVKYLPFAFTEHGAVMLATVLKSKRAVEVSVFVVKAFIHMRRMLGDQRQIILKLAELESKLVTHDKSFQVVFEALRKLMQKPKPEPEPERRKIGFQVREPFVAPYGAKAPSHRGKGRGRTPRGQG